MTRAAAEGTAEKMLLPIDTLFQTYPAVTVSDTAEKRIRNGNPFRCEEADGLRRIYSREGEFLAFANVTDGECRTVKSFFEVKKI